MLNKVIRRFSNVLFVSTIVTVLFSSTGCFGESKDRITSDAAMRSARLRKTLIDGMGHPIQYVGWNKKGDFKMITESQFLPVVHEEKNVQMMMFRYLLIPGAPWMQMKGKYYVAASSGANVVNVGEEAFRTLKVQGQEPRTLMMWKTWETNGKWIGCGRDNKIYECGDDGAGTQIGTLAYKELTIEPGETLKLFMTKGMFGDAKWEGEVGDTLYREEKEGQGKPIAKLEYRPVKLEDGSEAVLLMSRPMSDGAWVGVRDGKVIESNSK